LFILDHSWRRITHQVRQSCIWYFASMSLCFNEYMLKRKKKISVRRFYFCHPSLRCWTLVPDWKTVKSFTRFPCQMPQSDVCVNRLYIRTHHIRTADLLGRTGLWFVHNSSPVALARSCYEWNQRDFFGKCLNLNLNVNWDKNEWYNVVLDQVEWRNVVSRAFLLT